MPIRLSKKAQKIGYTYYPYQKEMIEELLASPTELIYNGCEMGLGKTPITLGYAYNRGYERTLIVCPASLRINWLREAEIWGGPNFQKGLAILSGKDIKHIESKNRWKKGRNPNPLIVSYDMLVSNKRLLDYVLAQPWDFVVADEIHECRNIEAQRTNIILQILANAPAFNVLSGTPMVKSGADLFPMMKSIVPYLDYLSEDDWETCDDHDFFTTKYSYKYRGKYGVQYKKVRNAEDLKDLVRVRGGFFYRRLKKDVLSELPNKTYRVVEVNFDIESEANTKEVSKFLSHFSEDPARSEGDAKRMPAIAKLRRDLGRAKVSDPDCIAYVTALLEAGNPVVLFAHHHDVIDTLVKTFEDWGVVKLDGRDSPAKKQQAVDMFQSGEADVFIGQLKAAGVGITLTRSSDAVFFEVDWLPSVMEQAIDRLHRITQKNAVTAHYLISKNVFDVGIIRSMIEKQRAIAKIFGD